MDEDIRKFVSSRKAFDGRDSIYGWILCQERAFCRPS